VTTPDLPTESWTDRIKAALGLSERASLREGLEAALGEAAKSGDVSAKEWAIVSNVLKVRNRRISEVMTPRARIVALAEAETLEEVLAAFLTSEHSRIPVYGESLDDPRGMIHLRDFLPLVTSTTQQSSQDNRRTQTLRDTALIRPLIFVPPSASPLDLLLRMQTRRVHLALVINEYGETDGLVTIEDLIEAIVGDINDEHDLPTAGLTRLDEQTWSMAAETPLAEAAAAIGHALPVDRNAIGVDSIGGYVTALAGRLPQPGEVIEGPGGLLFEVIEATPRQLLTLVLRLSANGETGAEEDRSGLSRGKAP